MATELARMFTWDCDIGAGRIDWSENSAEVIGCLPDELPETLRDAAFFVAEEDVGRLESAYRDGIAAGRSTVATEFRGRGDQRSARRFRAQARLLYGSDGAPRRVVGVTQDVTEYRNAFDALRESEKALLEADRRKDEFLATLAHELRNPLAPIKNAVQILQLRGGSDPSLAWARDVIERQLKQMVRLLDDLLEVNRVLRGKIELRKSRVALEAVIGDAIETSRPLLEGSRHELVVDLPDDLHIHGDAVRLAQVFANLLDNAARYTQRGGHIRLHAERQGSDVVVSVSDDGIGIDAEMLPRVFELFAQADSAREVAPGGLGIGLSIVKGLVELHGGQVEAYSTGRDRGSEFVVRLPAGAEELMHAAGAGPAVLQERVRRRVLIVDDVVDAADSLAALLEIVGHEVHTAYGGEEGVEAALALEPDVILLDLGMPKLDGFAACRAIRTELGERVAVIALTGWGQDEDRRRTAEAGFDEHLVKPVEPATLLDVLAALPEPGKDATSRTAP